MRLHYLPLALALGCAASSSAAHGPAQVTVPLHVEQHRPFVDVTLRKPDGTARSARFLVDSGGGSFLLVESLAREIGLHWDKVERGEGMEFGTVSQAPEAWLGDMLLEPEPQRVAILIGQESVLPPQARVRAEGMFPGYLLARHQVVFDFPNGTFTLARPGTLRPEGTPLPMPVWERSGFPRTELELDGARHGFLLDTGASFTMVSEVLLKKWGSAHPDWPRQQGASGEASTLGGQALETLGVHGASWGGRTLADFGVVSQREGTFEKWMSSMMAAPIEGSLAGNVLERYRIVLDYPNQKLYLSEPAH